MSGIKSEREEDRNPEVYLERGKIFIKEGKVQTGISELEKAYKYSGNNEKYERALKFAQCYVNPKMMSGLIEMENSTVASIIYFTMIIFYIANSDIYLFFATAAFFSMLLACVAFYRKERLKKFIIATLDLKNGDFDKYDTITAKSAVPDFLMYFMISAIIGAVIQFIKWIF